MAHGEKKREILNSRSCHGHGRDNSAIIKDHLELHDHRSVKDLFSG